MGNRAATNDDGRRRLPRAKESRSTGDKGETHGQQEAGWQDEVEAEESDGTERAEDMVESRTKRGVDREGGGSLLCGVVLCCCEK